jgi:hypothetical protein
MRGRWVGISCVMLSVVLGLTGFGVLAGATVSTAGVLASSDGADVEPEIEQDPGPGYEWSTSDACVGTWAADSDADGDSDDEIRPFCLHADAFSGGVLVPDETGPYDSDYLAELSPTPRYCDNGANKVRVLYVVTQGRADRYTALRPVLRAKTERADYWLFKSARDTDGSRHFRFACSADKIEIVKVVLSNSADLSYGHTINALRNAGYSASNRKYLAYLDWSERDPGQDVRDPSICGRGEIADDDRPGAINLNNNGNMFAVGYLKSNCGESSWAKLAMHELGHIMGAVQDSAPRHDTQNPGHPSDAYDRMAYGPGTTIVCSPQWRDARYDCNSNDYFDTSPGSGYLSDHWNIADNAFLVNS